MPKAEGTKQPILGVSMGPVMETVVQQTSAFWGFYSEHLKWPILGVSMGPVMETMVQQTSPFWGFYSEHLKWS
jgi:hypothetical protein